MTSQAAGRQACLLQQCHFAALFLANTHTHNEGEHALLISFAQVEASREIAAIIAGAGSQDGVGKKEKKRDRLQELLCLVKPAVNEQNTASQVKEARETSFHANKLRVSRSANPAHSGADRPQFSCIKEKANDTDANLF